MVILPLNTSITFMNLSKASTYLWKMYYHTLWEAFCKRNDVNDNKHPCIHSSSVLSYSLWCSNDGLLQIRCSFPHWRASVTVCVFAFTLLFVHVHTDLCLYQPCAFTHTVSLRNLKDRRNMFRKTSRMRLLYFCSAAQRVMGSNPSHICIAKKSKCCVKVFVAFIIFL